MNRRIKQMNFIIVLTLATLAQVKAQTPSTSTSSPGASSTTLPGVSTTLPNESTTQPGISTTLPNESTTQPGISTTLPGAAKTTLPSTTLLTTQPVVYNSGIASAGTTLPTANPPSSAVSGIAQSTVVYQSGQSGAASSSPLSGTIQSTISGQPVAIQSQANTNIEQSTQVSQQQWSNAVQSQMPASNAVTDLQSSSTPSNEATLIPQSVRSSMAQPTIPDRTTVPATATQRYSSVVPSSLAASAASTVRASQATAQVTQYPPSFASNQQSQTNFPSSQVAPVQSTFGWPIMSSVFGASTQQSTYSSTAKPSPNGQTTLPNGMTTFAPETPTHVQIMFANNYTDSIPAGTNLTKYCEDLLPYVAAAAGVPTDRITNMAVAEQPETGGVVLRFIVQPYPSGSCWWTGTCGITVQQAVLRLNSLVVTTKSLRLPVANSTDLTVANYGDKYKVFQSWKDDGLCPDSLCDSDTEVCDCKLTGTLYCRKIKSKPQLLYLLLLLLLIPIIIAIVLIVYYLMLRKKKQDELEQKKKNERRMVRADMLSYHEYVSRDKEQVQPKVATVASRSTLNDATLNTLCRSLGENISIAFNGSTFVDVNGTDNSDASSSDSILPNNNL